MSFMSSLRLDKQTRNIEFLLAGIEEYKTIFQPTHIFQSYLYIMALEYYITNNLGKKYIIKYEIFMLYLTKSNLFQLVTRPDELADFLTKYLVVVELHFGKYSKSLMCGRCSMMLHILDMYTGCPL